MEAVNTDNDTHASVSSRSTNAALQHVPERYNLPGDSGDAKKQRRLVQFSFFCPDRLQTDVDTLSAAYVPLDILDEPNPPQVCAIGWLCTRDEDAIASACERLAVEGQLGERYGTTNLPEAVERALANAAENPSSAEQTLSRMPVLKGTPIGPIRSWCLQFGIEPRIYVETDDAWYHVVYYEASPEYTSYFESARSKFEVAVRADLLCAKSPRVRLRPAVDLTYGYVTFSLTLPFAAMRPYNEEQVHQVAAFLLEQAAELDSYLPESHFLSVVARRRELGGAPSRSLSEQVLSEEKRRRLMHHLLHLLADICRRHDARDLRELTNEQKFPGYRQIVPAPLDLNLIMHRLQAGQEYRPDDPATVVRDIRQVFKNCRLYSQSLDRESQKALVRANRVELLFDEQLIRLETAVQQDLSAESAGFFATTDATPTPMTGAVRVEYNLPVGAGVAANQAPVPAVESELDTPASQDNRMDVDWAHRAHPFTLAGITIGQDAEAIPKRQAGKRRKQPAAEYQRDLGPNEAALADPARALMDGKALKSQGDGRTTRHALTCAYPICSNEPRRGSKYCSDECGCAVAILRLSTRYQSLPRGARKALLAAEAVARRLATAGKESQRAAEALLKEQEMREQEQRASQPDQTAVPLDAAAPPSLEPLPALAPDASASDHEVYTSLQGLATEMEELQHQLASIDARIADLAVEVAAAPDDRCGYGGYCQWSASRGHRSVGTADTNLTESLESSAESTLNRPCPMHGNWRASKPLEYHRERQHIISRMHNLVSMSHRLGEHLRGDRRNRPLRDFNDE